MTILMQGPAEVVGSDSHSLDMGEVTLAQRQASGNVSTYLISSLISRLISSQSHLSEVEVDVRKKGPAKWNLILTNKNWLEKQEQKGSLAEPSSGWLLAMVMTGFQDSRPVISTACSLDQLPHAQETHLIP